MDRRQMQIAFVGGGNMARAIVAGLLRDGHAAKALRIADPDASQRERIGQLSADLHIGNDNETCIAGAEMIVLAVKPQHVAELGKSLRPRPGQLIVSIAAGISLGRLGELFGADQPRVRIMPNQPAQVGAGMSVLCAAHSTGPAHRDSAAYLAAATGEIAWLDDESLMDAVTAVSGSGPAYFYLVMELLEEAARDMGIPAEVACLLATQTAKGAGLAARETGIPPADLRRMVTSPGGTTEAAIAALERGGVRELVRAALEAARQRSRELGDSSGK